MDITHAPISDHLMSYIGDMAVLETKEFTLKKVMDGCRQGAENLLHATEKQADLCDQLKEKQNMALEELSLQKNPVEPDKPAGFDKYLKKHGSDKSGKYNFPKPNKHCFTFGQVFGIFMLFLGISAVVFLAIALLGSAVSDIDIKIEKMYGTGVMVLCFIVPACLISFCFTLLPCIIECIKHHKSKRLYFKYLPYTQEYAQYIDAKNDYQRYHDAYKEAERKYLEERLSLEMTRMRCYAILDSLFGHLDTVLARFGIILEKQEELYDISIIPPDYRDMVSVIVLHQIIYSGASNTVADAILLYEDKLARGVISRDTDQLLEKRDLTNPEMKPVEKHLDQVTLEAQMMISDIQNRLDLLTRELDRLTEEFTNHVALRSPISQEFDRFCEKHGDIVKRWQAEHMETTQASLYAAKTEQDLREALARYMELHRQGLL